MASYCGLRLHVVVDCVCHWEKTAGLSALTQTDTDAFSCVIGLPGILYPGNPE
jgi:hypothetical protein